MQKEMMEENTQKILTPPPMQNPIGKFHMGHHTLW